MVDSIFKILTMLCFIAERVECQKEEDVLESTANLLLSLLNPVPPRGSPFPIVEGPKIDDRVCVVGGGPAGIHMALSLQRRKYSNVEVFEKSNRVGGKCHDININGKYQPLGAVFGLPYHFNNIVGLAKEFGLGETVPIVPPTVWTNNTHSSGQSTAEYILSSISALSKSSSIEVNNELFITTVIRYVSLHKELFGTYEGDLMLRPSQSILQRVKGTFMEFLIKEDFLPLVPMFQLLFTRPGLGHLDETAALYGLIWNNPEVVVTASLLAIGKDRDPHSIYVLKEGFDKLWRTIVEREEIKVHFNVDIDRIQRNGISVDMNVWSSSVMKKEVCDWLIWTPSMVELLKTVEDPSQHEQYFFRSLKPTIFTGHTVQMKNGIRYPYNAYLETINRKVEHGVIGAISVDGFLTPGIRTSEGQEAFSQNNTENRLALILQMGSSYSNQVKLREIVRNHFKNGFEAEDIDILSTISWSNFPRWNPEDVTKGNHWDSFEHLQGKNRMWYAGSSLSVESVGSVIEYNNLLLRQLNNLTSVGHFDL